MNMIEEIKTPSSTPVSGTPQPSPMIERSSMVGINSLSKISVVYLLIRLGLNLQKDEGLGWWQLQVLLSSGASSFLTLMVLPSDLT